MINTIQMRLQRAAEKLAEMPCPEDPESSDSEPTSSEEKEADYTTTTQRWDRDHEDQEEVAAAHDEPKDDLTQPLAGGDSEQVEEPTNVVTPPEEIPSIQLHPNGGMTAQGPLDTETIHQPEGTLSRGRFRGRNCAGRDSMHR